MPNRRPAIQMSIDAKGNVVGCEIAVSSGNPGFDLHLCEIARERLRFRPTLDVFGDPMPLHYEQFFDLSHVL